MQSAVNTLNKETLEMTGYYFAIGYEAGLTIKIYKKLSVDFGLVYSPVLYSDKQASYLFSVLPGIGALGNVQGIITIKYFK